MSATVAMKRISPLVARSLSSRVCRTDSVSERIEKRLAAVRSTMQISQRTQHDALRLLAGESGDLQAPDALALAGQLAQTWMDEDDVAGMCDHYALVFGGENAAGGWREERDRILQTMRRQAGGTLLHKAHDPVDFTPTRIETLQAAHKSFGEEFGWLLMNRGVQNRVKGWLRDAGYRFDWQIVHQDRFNGEVFTEMILHAPWNRRVMLSRNELLLEDAGAILLSHTAPLTVDVIEKWLKPGVRPPAGLTKKKLTRVWEEMLIDLQARDRLLLDQHNRMVDPLT